MYAPRPRFGLDMICTGPPRLQADALDQKKEAVDMGLPVRCWPEAGSGLLARAGLHSWMGTKSRLERACWLLLLDWCLGVSRYDVLPI